MKQMLASTEGKIKTGATEYTVTCAGLCGASHIAHLHSKSEFIAELRHHSWEPARKKWWCSLCIHIKGRKP